MGTDREQSELQIALETLRHERLERKSAVLDRARAALAAARDDQANGLDVDEDVILELERSIAEFERFTIERPGLPPDL